MPTGEDQARAGLAESVRKNRQQMEITQESRELLSATLRDEMGDAFARGLKEAMTSDNARLFVRAMFAEAQSMATEKTGEVVGGAVVALLKRGALFLFLGGIVYAVGGWGALAGLIKWLAGPKG
jgi:hypothetical protein